VTSALQWFNRPGQSFCERVTCSRKLVRAIPIARAQVASLKKKVRVPLIQRPKTHAAIFNVSDAQRVGLPAVAE
jgi:hypothetical protein